MFDSHLHLDQLNSNQVRHILADELISGVLAVSTDLASAKQLLQLQRQAPSKLHIAAGFHPEQALPDKMSQQALFDWIIDHRQYLTAIGEVGLPYYLKREQPSLDYAPYLALLSDFIQLAKRLDLPLNLHVVHSDVALTMQLLEKYQFEKAHFHWFKTDEQSLADFLAAPYFASVTPDILWNVNTQKVAQKLPLDRLLIETDSPWQHQNLVNTSISTQLDAILTQLAILRNESKATIAQQT